MHERQCMSELRYDHRSLEEGEGRGDDYIRCLQLNVAKSSIMAISDGRVEESARVAGGYQADVYVNQSLFSAAPAKWSRPFTHRHRASSQSSTLSDKDCQHPRPFAGTGGFVAYFFTHDQDNTPSTYSYIRALSHPLTPTATCPSQPPTPGNTRTRRARHSPSSAPKSTISSQTSRDWVSPSEPPGTQTTDMMRHGRRRWTPRWRLSGMCIASEVSRASGTGTSSSGMWMVMVSDVCVGDKGCEC